MSKYKICVYAISKNEEKFVHRFCEAVQEADAVYVLDTGSTDNSVPLLKEHGVHVTEKEIKPWRFDVARNLSLELVPKDTDICVCLDLDEVIESGWRKKLEELWQRDTTRLRYNYNWSFDDKNNPEVNFYIEKIHSRNDYIWTHPVHEVLAYQKLDQEEKFITTDEITVNHYPDKEKSRSSYLPLLELSVEENPFDDRNMHYLGREYMYYHKWNESIDTLIRHLNLKSAIWKDERAASMRFIARCYQELNRVEEARMWQDKAIEEAPYLRDGYIERAMLEYSQKNYQECISFIEKALTIKEKTKTYINEPFSWNGTPYDLLSVAYYEIGDYKKAIENVKEALKWDNENERLLKNLAIFESLAK